MPRRLAGQPKGRPEAALHDAIAQGPRTGRPSQQHPGEVLDRPPGPWPAHSGPVFPLWSGQRRQDPSGHPLPFPFSGSWSPQTEAKFRGLGTRGEGPWCGVRGRGVARPACSNCTHPPSGAPRLQREPGSVFWASCAANSWLLNHGTQNQGRDFVLQRGTQSLRYGKC